METQELTEYERKRLENIRRNQEMVAALKLHSKAAELTKRPRVAIKSYDEKLEKKPKIETPVVIRRSSRTRGAPPDYTGLVDPVYVNILAYKPPTRAQPDVKDLGPLSMSEAQRGSHRAKPDCPFLDSLLGRASKEEQFGGSRKSGEFVKGNSAKKGKKKNEGSLNLESLTLDPENVARIVPGRILQVQFLPSSSNKMVVVGNKTGHIAFWGVGKRLTYLYRPHNAPISGILVQPHCLSKIYTSCYDGVVRLMDAEKEIFDLVFNRGEGIFSLSQPKNDSNCIYFGDGSGVVTVWDCRSGKNSSSWALHENKVNTVDFNCENPHIVATGSTDRTACTWDLRYTSGDKPTALKTLTHQKSVQSAYFSPSGCSLATTCLDNTISIYSGVNLEDATSIYHDNFTGRWLSTFRAIWGWDDSYLFIGSMKRGVDVVSATQRAIVTTLQSPHMSAIPCRFDAHYNEVGMLAGATSGGQVYIWTLQ